MVIATNDTPAAANSATVADQGLYVLVAFLRSHGIGVDPEQLRHRFGNAIGVPEMLRCAKELGLKARCFRTNWKRLATTPLPGVAVLRDGSFLFLGKDGEGKAIVQSPLTTRTTMLKQ